MILKKGNKVKVLTGKDKSKEGEIIEIDRQNSRIEITRLNKNVNIQLWLTITN